MQKLVITTIVGGLFAASSAVAGDFSVPLTTAPAASNLGDLAVGYNSQHVFRGVNLGNDQVTAELGLAHTCPLTGLALDFTAWYGSASSNNATAPEDELRLTLSTSKDLGFADATVGYTFYHFLNGNKPSFTGNGGDSQEVFFGLSRELYGVDASLTYFWDIEGDNQGYTELGLSKSLNVFGKALDLGATVGYLVEEGALSHATVSVSHDIAFGNATLTPYVAYSVELDDLEQSSRSNGSDENELFAGAALKVQF